MIRAIFFRASSASFTLRTLGADAADSRRQWGRKLDSILHVHKDFAYFHLGRISFHCPVLVSSPAVALMFVHHGTDL